MDRRTFLTLAAAGTGAAMLGGDFWRAQYAFADVTAGSGPYGPLADADRNGIQLPAGFTSRVIARSGDVVGDTGYAWHGTPDGGACLPHPDGGWVYASNSEIGGGGGGASAVRFDAAGTIVGAYRLLSGTSRNCSG